MAYEQLKLSNQLCHRFYVASNAITRAYRPHLKEINLTYPQYIVLMALWENNNLPINKILAQTLIDPGALSLILNKLKDKGFISISGLKSDKRIKVISLTKQGDDLKVKAAEIPSKIKCLTPSIDFVEFEELKRIIDKINDDLSV